MLRLINHSLRIILASIGEYSDMKKFRLKCRGWNYSNWDGMEGRVGRRILRVETFTTQRGNRKNLVNFY